MKISIVIPTRSRAIYLKGCLESVLIAADAATCPVEIVVSDNVSTDDTKTVVAEFADNRILYSLQSERVSMRQNFEDALSHTSGTHVLFIGDDDGILPNGLRILQKIIEDYDPEIIKWRTLNFKWPNDQTQVSGHLVIRPLKLSGRIRKVAASAIKDMFFAGKQASYNDGGMIYHGCVSRKLIDRVRDLSKGNYFWCSMPDVYTSVANMLAAKADVFRIDRPISIGGASPRSNGDSAKNLAQTGDATKAKEILNYIDEARNDPFRSPISNECLSIELHLLGAMKLACELQDIPFEFNRKNWLKRIEKEISTFTPSMAAACDDGVKYIFGADTDLKKPVVAKVPAAIEALEDGKKVSEGVPASVKHRLTKTIVSGGAQMENIVQAAQFLDDLVGNSDLDKALRPTNPVVEILRIKRELKGLMR